jgi:hypothetical protein
MTRCLRDHEESPLPLPLLRAVWGGGGEGRPPSSLALAGLDGDDNRNGNCLSKKRLDKGKGEEGFNDGFVFSCRLILLLFLAFLFQCRSIDFLSKSSELLDGLLLQDFSFSHSNLGVD